MFLISVEEGGLVCATVDDVICPRSKSKGEVGLKL